MLRIGVVDSDILVAKGIAVQLQELGYEPSACGSNYQEGLAILEQKQSDLLLIDYKLGANNSGIDLAEQAYQKYGIPFLYLITTAKEAQYCKALLPVPAAFISKPFSKPDLYRCIEMLVAKRLPAANAAHSPFHFIKYGEQIVKVYEQHILYIENESVYIHVHTRTKNILLRTSSAAFLNKLTAEHFYRTHRSYMVNINHIDAVMQSSVMVKGKEIPLSKANRQELLRRVKML